MIFDAGSQARFRGGLSLAFALMFGLGLASFHGSAFARVDGEWEARGQLPAASDARYSGTIVVADNHHDNDNKKHKYGNNHGNNDWDKNGYKGWSQNHKNHGKGWSGYSNNWNKNWNRHAYVRNWNHRPYYGEFIGGVVLGSILAANGVGVVPYAPEPYLCWYWADPYMYRGYWDYCD
jgi:hypothetical protein